jgi:hypothetical protein
MAIPQSSRPGCCRSALERPLVVPCLELLVDQGLEDVGMSSWSTLHQLLHLIWDVDCKERALRARDKEALGVDLFERRPFVFFWYICCCGECREAKDHVERLSMKKVYCCILMFCCSVLSPS